MNVNKMTFVIWAILGCAFVLLGIYTLNSKKVTRYWANVKKKIEVTDVKKYNHAAGMLWIGYGIVLIMLGLPLRTPGNVLGVMLFSVIGTMFVTIAFMVGLIKIEAKYEKR